jgi:ATP-dependent Clp protease ATP-binding subunit ClpB
MAVADREPVNINLLLPQSNDALEGRRSRSIFEGFLSPPLGSTPLHYACLQGNMKIVEVLLRNGADWTVSDGNDLLPMNYISVNGDSKMQEFKRLCEEEELRRAERLAEEELRRARRLSEEEELRWAGRFAEELELECAKDISKKGGRLYSIVDIIYKSQLR